MKSVCVRETLTPIEIVEELRIGVAGEVNDGGSLLAPGRRRVEQELWGASEHVLGAKLDRGATDMLILVAEGDALRAGTVGLARHGTRDLCVLDVARHHDLLAGLNVRADPDGKLRVAT